MSLSKAGIKPKQVMEVLYEEFISEIKRSGVNIDGIKAESDEG